VLSISTTRRGESTASGWAISSRLNRCQTSKVFRLREGVPFRTTASAAAALHDLPGADQPKGQILGEPLGVVDILIIRAK
jgi:hypothetical protein